MIYQAELGRKTLACKDCLEKSSNEMLDNMDYPNRPHIPLKHE